MKTVTITQEEYDELLKAKAYYDEAEAEDLETGVYKLDFSCGRQGDLTGIFTAEHRYAKALVESGVDVHFGEVLGKHSDICGPIEEGELILVSSKKRDIESCVESGHNPFHEQTPEGEDILDYLDRYLSGDTTPYQNYEDE